MRRYSYPAMAKGMGEFQLTVEPGEFTDSEIIVMLGENGTGKTTFIRLMAGYLKPDEGGKGIYSETCANGHLYSETTCIKRPLRDVPKESA